MTTRCGLGASVSVGPEGFAATGEGEGKVATSANLCSGSKAGSSDSSIAASMAVAAGSSSDPAIAENCGIALVISSVPNQSCGGVAMPQTLAGISSSTPTCCNSRVLCDT